MHGRRWLLVVVALAGTFAVAAIGASTVASADAAAECTTPERTVKNISTDEDVQFTSGGVEVHGDVRVSDDDEFLGWFEYRAAGSDGGWRTTERTEYPTNACGMGYFEATLTDVAPNTTYEYRAVARAGNDTARGDVRTFTTGPANRTPTDANESTAGTPATDTPTSYPCPEYRGVGSLCTGTPTPASDPPTDGPPDDSGPIDPGTDARTEPWLAGYLPLFAWLAAVVVLAPMVLGGLLGVDSLRDR